jgi:hypothetical protein
MAKQTISVGTVQNDGTGSTIRAGGTIINDNFTEVYSFLGGNTLPSTTKITTRTPTNTGQAGDVAGLVVADSDYLYVCTGTYDGSTIIWKKITLNAY